MAALRPRFFLLILFLSLSYLLSSAPHGAEAQYIQDLVRGTDPNGNPADFWRPNLNANLGRVWYWDHTAVFLTYNCAYMTAICKNAENFLRSPRGRSRPYPERFAYDFGRRTSQRRRKSCPSSWASTHTCPEIAQPTVWRQDRYWPYTDLDPVQVPRNVIRHERDSNGNVINPSYLRYTCDEFPPATWVEGGSGPANNYQQAETICAAYRCPGTAGMKIYGEQNWQARAHTTLRRILESVVLANLGRGVWNPPTEPVQFGLVLDKTSGNNGYPASVVVAQANGMIIGRNDIPLSKRDRVAEVANMTSFERREFLNSATLEDLENAGYHLTHHHVREEEMNSTTADESWFGDTYGLANFASVRPPQNAPSPAFDITTGIEINSHGSLNETFGPINLSRSSSVPKVKRYISLAKNATAAQLAAARKKVDAAILESGRRNERRYTNMARNRYKLKPGTIVGNSAVGDMAKQDLPAAEAAPPPPLFEVTPELAAAAALLAEADALGITGGSTNISFTNSTTPDGVTRNAPRAVGTFWMEGIARKGTVAWGNDPSYKVFRNVRDYGAVGDGKKDDTAAIKKAITDGNRCGKNCNGSTLKNAIVYFPPGTYLVTGKLALPFGTQIIGDAKNWPTILADSRFIGTSVVSTDEYTGGGKGPDGLDQEWFINTANFYRQIRNLRIDITATRDSQGVACIHYQFVELIAKTGTKQRGIVAENGSGGVLADITFTGGSYGIWGGEQQFTAQRLTFNGCSTAVQVIWDWGWVWQSIKVSNADVGFRLLPDENSTAPGHIGSATFLDSTFSNVGTAVLIAPLNSAAGSGSTGVVIDNVVFNSVSKAVADTSGKTLLSASGKVASWVAGPVYAGTGGKREFYTGKTGPTYAREKTLLDSSGSYFQRAKPQYENRGVGDFVHLKDMGAAGDGVTDDTSAVQAALQSSVGKVLFVDAGTYVLTRTVVVPSGTKIVGEAWSQFAASGSFFANPRTPRVMFQVGFPGQVGDVEMQDLIFTTKGQTPGVILVQWNIKASSPGSAGIWDCHTRIGGATGTGLTPAECPASTTGINPNCQGASMMMHVTKEASGYFDNMWLWVADHIIDDPLLEEANNTMEMISVYVGRGMLIESQTATWLYGTASEHSVYYQYNFHGAKNVFAGFLQTESPYYQPNPKPPQPFQGAVGVFPGDPHYKCKGGDFDGCDSSWAVMIRGSSNIMVAGAGVYSWFSTYTQDCISLHQCQKALVLLENNGANVRLQNLITIGAKYSLVQDGKGLLATDNLNVNSHPRWSQISIFDTTSNEIIWIDPKIWKSANPTVWCQPPCLLKFPPWTGATQTYNYPIMTATLPGGSTTRFTKPPITATAWLIENVSIDSSGKQVVPGNAKREALEPETTLSPDMDKRQAGTTLGSIWVTFATTPVWPTAVFRLDSGIVTSTRPSSPTHPPPPAPAGPKSPPSPALGGEWPTAVILLKGDPSPRVGYCVFGDPSCDPNFWDVFDGGYLGSPGGEFGYQNFTIIDSDYEDPEEQSEEDEGVMCPITTSTTSATTTAKTTPTPTAKQPNQASPQANTVECYGYGAKADHIQADNAFNSFCNNILDRGSNVIARRGNITARAGGQKTVLGGGTYLEYSAPFPVSHDNAIKIDMSIEVAEDCEWVLDSDECHRYLKVPIDSCNCNGENGKEGGIVKNNCLTIRVDPNCQSGSICL
ncbi:pectin lyase-like protein [Rhypophila sp. PSN 637]